MQIFLARNAGEDGCWEWNGYRNADGYGLTKHNGKTSLAHRVAYILTKGPIPEGLGILHRCDNPPCCNPEHLFTGTQKDNYADARGKDRHTRGQRSSNAKLDEAAVRDIRSASVPLLQLAKKYGVRFSLVWRVKKGLAWTHVQD
jgi:hypothetical protein